MRNLDISSMKILSFKGALHWAS